MTASILYLHGFRSSPASWKSMLLAEAMKERGLEKQYVCPALSHVPSEAFFDAELRLRKLPRPVTLVGSSLGGYMAIYLAEKHDLKAVLINPAVDAVGVLENWVGTQINLHTRVNFEFTYEHLEQLKRYAVPDIDPSRYLLLIETGDQVVDYHLAVERFAQSQQVVVEGGEHLFLSFPEYLDQVLDFCGIPVS